MGRADSKPQEGDSSLLLAAQVAGGARAQRCARDSRVGGTQGQVHGVDRGAMESETCCANFLEVPAMNRLTRPSLLLLVDTVRIAGYGDRFTLLYSCV